MVWEPAKPNTSTKIKDAPAIFQGNWNAIEDWTENQHSALGEASSGMHQAGLCSIVKVDSTANIAALSNVACAIAFDTTLWVFKYNDGATWQNIGGPIEQGTLMVFYQDTAPPGWTIQTTLNDKLIYITKGSAASGEIGGSACSSGSWTISGFEANVGGYTLAIADIPSHYHRSGYEIGYILGLGALIYYSYNNYSGPSVITTQATGGDGSHNHAMASHSGLWRPQSSVCIICTKN